MSMMVHEMGTKQESDGDISDHGSATQRLGF